MVVPTHLKYDIMTSSRDRVATWRSKNDGVKVSWDDDIPNMMGKS